MEQVVYLNGSIVPAEDAGISALSPAALYGRGVFTTIAIFESRLFLWEKHWRRLVNNAKALDVDLEGYTEDTVRIAAEDFLTSHAPNAGRCRITIFDTSSATLWPHRSEHRSSLLITAGEGHSIGNSLKLGLSAYAVNSQSPLAGFKSCNYLENVLALENGRRSEFDECIRLNEKGEITSACMANVFWLRDDQLFTPALSTGCIPGTTRELILEKLDCIEITAGEVELHRAASIFLTSAGLGVREAASYMSRVFTPSQHPIFKVLP
jgi:branched-chain amino acid aminotransferase